MLSQNLALQLIPILTYKVSVAGYYSDVPVEIEYL